MFLLVRYLGAEGWGGSRWWEVWCENKIKTRTVVMDGDC